VDYWSKYMTIVDKGAHLGLSPDLEMYGSKYIFLEECGDGSETYYWEAYAEISKDWEQAGGRALLELTRADVWNGWRRLAALGVPRESWFVCLHVRSAGFKPVHDQLHDALNADICTYDAAIDAIVERGGWVIRMGDASMPKLQPRDRVVDYAHSPEKADWMDVFLCGTCWFYIGTSSGLGYVPNLFGVPSVFTNWFPTGALPLNGTDLFIPKLHWHDKQGQFAPFRESLAPPLGHVHAKSTLNALGVYLCNNSPEDLRDVVVEMLDRLEAKAVYTADDKQLQGRFTAVAASSRSSGNAQIGREFIRKHRHLLTGDGPSCS